LRIIAQENGCRYLLGYYTSKYSSKSAEKLGYKLLKKEMYEEMVDPFTGEKKFGCIVEAHSAANTMYLDLENSAK